MGLVETITLLVILVSRKDSDTERLILPGKSEFANSGFLSCMPENISPLLSGRQLFSWTLLWGASSRLSEKHFEVKGVYLMWKPEIIFVVLRK
ncbi:unnamed protein product [Dovyalis caffra]|uniref:Uncharacterized protein n=1 Tax=Dovyalis caffra TaxID=77055 RepID=A0AAV1QWT5_9ROSI|nr:unnamed protein product [Dovyalis caffra]